MGALLSSLGQPSPETEISHAAEQLDAVNEPTSDDGATLQDYPSLLTLPAELRNEIYELLLVYEKPIEVRDRRRSDNPMREPGLLLTCHFLRKEGLPIFYGSNCFSITDGYAKSFLPWLDGQRISMIRSLKLCYSGRPLSGPYTVKQYCEMVNEFNMFYGQNRLPVDAIMLSLPMKGEHDSSGEDTRWIKFIEIEEVKVVEKENGDWRVEYVK